jgi:hypothetical protein
MIKHPTPNDPQSAFCEVCLKLVPKSGALMSEGKDYVAYFCSAGCYESWQGKREPAAVPEGQEGLGRSIARDERMKRAAKQHPQRDEPRLDSVERDDIPPS